LVILEIYYEIDVNKFYEKMTDLLENVKFDKLSELDISKLDDELRNELHG
jgi:hypothetical protein